MNIYGKETRIKTRKAHCPKVRRTKRHVSRKHKSRPELKQDFQQELKSL